MTSSVIVLTKTYMYWGERPLREALRLIINGKAEVVRADEGREIRAGISRDGVVFKMPAPLVVRLLEFAGIFVKNEEVRWSKEAVYERDKNVCQYWHFDERGRRIKHKCTEDERTIDHLVPRSHGGKNIFINTVCACRWHNITVKKGRTPREASLELIRLPEIPRRRRGDLVILSFAFNPANKAHQAMAELGLVKE